MWPGPLSIPVTSAPPVMGDMPTSSYGGLPCFLVGRRQETGAESRRCAPYTVRAESLGHAERCEVWRRGESTHGTGATNPGLQSVRHPVSTWCSKSTELELGVPVPCCGHMVLLRPPLAFVSLCFKVGGLSLRSSDLPQVKMVCPREPRDPFVPSIGHR